MKNKIKLKKASNKVNQPFLTHLKTQFIDSKEVYQGTSESETADSGRSMVEMLGVLAVVGVLSVGGILGYKYAMNKYQANQIVNELNLTSSQMAIMLMRPHTADFELSLGEPYDDGHIATNALAFNFGCGTGAAGEDANCATDNIKYFSEVQNLPKEVCQNLVQLAQSLPYLEEVLVNEASDETGALCEDNSTVRCLFNADQNALIDDNPDPEVTETETYSDNGGCGPHAYLEYEKCRCDDGWYNPIDGFYFQTNEGKCTLSQADADKKYCNNNGTWQGYIPACYCNTALYDDSNNYCRDNGGCCQGVEISSYAPEVTVSGDNRCGPHAYYDGWSCLCDEGWYNSDSGIYYQTNEGNCTLSQEEANKRFCNSNGIFYYGPNTGVGCICNDGTKPPSYCLNNGGCCRPEISDSYAPETTTTKADTTTTITTTTSKASTTTTPETTTPETTVSYTPEVSVSGYDGCGINAYRDENGKCLCERGWFSPEGKYYEYNDDTYNHDPINCTMSQAEADEQFCNGKGTWDRGVGSESGHGGCICNNGVSDVSNNACKDNDGCCRKFCTSNSNCKSGEYCRAYAYSCSQEFGGSKTDGVCQTSTGTTKTISGLGSVTMGSYTMSWWSAERFCQSLGKRMVSLADLGCSGTVYDACKNSQIVKDLYSAFGYSSIWTSDQKGDNCNAYKVYLGDGRVSAYNRTYSNSALCK